MEEHNTKVCLKLTRFLGSIATAFRTCMELQKANCSFSAWVMVMEYIQRGLRLLTCETTNVLFGESFKQWKEEMKKGCRMQKQRRWTIWHQKRRNHSIKFCTAMICSDKCWSRASLGLSSKMKTRSNRDKIAALIFRFSFTVFARLHNKISNNVTDNIMYPAWTY